METIKRYKQYLIYLYILVVSVFAIFAYMQIKNDNHKFYETKEGLSKQEKIIDSLTGIYTKTENKIAEYLSHKETNDSIRKINELQIKKFNKDLSDIRDKVIDNKDELVRLEKENEETLKSLWTHQIEYFALIIALLVGLIFFANLEHLAKEKMEKEIAKITNREIQDIRENYTQFIRHNTLKKDAEILVLNEKGTNFNEAFTEVMDLFDVRYDSDQRIDVAGLEDAISDTVISKLSNADIVIIENQNNGDNEKVWKLGLLPRNINTKDDLNKIINKLKDRLKAYQSLTAVVINEQQPDNHLPIIKELLKDYHCKIKPWDLILMLDQVDAPDRSLAAKAGCVENKIDINICMQKKKQNELLKVLSKYFDIKIKDLKDKISQYKNQLAMVELADKLCKHEVSLFYYGLGNFPVKLVNEKYQKWVSFANAPSQLYGNMLNMLKFKYEISEKFRNKLSKND
jgi:hypothetical protein